MAFSSCVKTLCLISILVEVADVSSLYISSPRVCIVGAGYSGLATARHMKDYGLNFKVFEASRYIGGDWRFDPHVGTDEDGLPIFTSQYKNLRTNTPRQTMEFEGFPFPEDAPSFPSGDCFYKYIQSFVKHFNLLPNIQFRSLITEIRRVKDKWNVTYLKTDMRQQWTEQCDFVVIATGMYNVPHLPNIQGQNVFKGKIMHSHDYKDAEHYRGARLMLVGAGSSGIDLAIQLANVTSKLVHSHHRLSPEPKFVSSKKYIKKPDILYFTSNGAVFQDETYEDFDIVIFCTGYDLYHPFLKNKTSGMKTTKKYILPLYRHIVNIKYPSMTFVGVSKNIITRVWDAQGHYSAALAAGKFKLPSEDEMIRQWNAHMQNLRRKHYNITAVNVIDMELDEYFEILANEAGISHTPKVLTGLILKQLSGNDNLLNYRNYDYRIINETHFERKYNPRKVNYCPVNV